MASRFDPHQPGSSPVPQQRGVPESGCRVTLVHSDEQGFLIVSGEIDIQTVETLRDALSEATSLCAHVLVNLDNVTFIGAAGLGALVGADQASRLAGGRVQVRTTNPFTLRLLTLTGLRHLTLSA